MTTRYIGIDIAKETFVAATKTSKGYKVKQFANSVTGFQALVKWVGVTPVNRHFCMESTGKYGNALALFLYNTGDAVSVINPAKIKHFMKSQLARNKTDSIDAKLIAQYCELFKPNPWQPASDAILQLQALVKRLDTLSKMKFQEQNRLELADKVVKNSIVRNIKHLQKEIKDLEKQVKQQIGGNPELKEKEQLLLSIPGVGPKTTSKIIAFLGAVEKFQNAKQMAAYVGLNPHHYQSGSSLNHSKLSRTGDSDLRKMLYMPALVAIKHNPIAYVFYQNLVARGKPKKVAICAIMRKLVHTIYGVLKNQQCFNPAHTRT